jgi:Flp pilus assembly pilin Flp
MRRSERQGSGWWTRAGDHARAESGQTMSEYAVVLGMLILAVAGVFTLFATGINDKLQDDLMVILSAM